MAALETEKIFPHSVPLELYLRKPFFLSSSLCPCFCIFFGYPVKSFVPWRCSSPEPLHTSARGDEKRAMVPLLLQHNIWTSLWACQSQQMRCKFVGFIFLTIIIPVALCSTISCLIACHHFDVAYSPFAISLIFAFACFSFDAFVCLPHPSVISQLLVSPLIIVSSLILEKTQQHSRHSSASGFLVWSALTSFPHSKSPHLQVFTDQPCLMMVLKSIHNHPWFTTLNKICCFS